MSKSAKIFTYIIYIISVIVCLGFYVFNGSVNKMVSSILNWAYILCALAVLITLIMPFFYRSGGSSKKTVWEFGVVVLLCLVSFLIASGNPVDAHVATPPTHATLKWIDASLILSIILLVCAFLCAVLSGLFKQRK